MVLFLPVHVAKAQVAAAASLTHELTRVRTALGKHGDPTMAVHDGYMSLVGCIDYPKGAREGTMQFVAGGDGNALPQSATGGSQARSHEAPVLIHEPTSDDRLRLVAAEWFMPDQLAIDGAPKIFGRTLAGQMEGHNPQHHTPEHQ